MSARLLEGDGITRDAIMSECGAYRYALTRSWSDGPVVTWTMLNPSTADATVDDPTIRRCITFSRDWGFGALVVVNLFALRSTDPKALRIHPHPVGPQNVEHIEAAIQLSDLAVAAWGAFDAHRGRSPVEAIAADARVPLVCLGKTRGGHPRHPLYVPGDQERIAFGCA